MPDKRQKAAITYAEGPLLIVAGPGSGKTYTLIERIKYLVGVRGIEPESILVVTFSRKAAEEMKERYNGEGVVFGTFHSVFYGILRKAYGFEASEFIFGEYEEDEVLFDEMLTMTRELLERRGDIRDLIKQRFKWILIDEYQDIDRIQYDIIRLITDKDSNITVVGDDDQSIYGFRGASPDYMQRFRKDYSRVKRIILNHNYRSTPEIVGTSQKLIKHNKKRIRKHILSARDSGEKVRLISYPDVRSELVSVCNDILFKLQRGYKKEDIVILYRTQAEKYSLDLILKEFDLDLQTMTFHASKGLEFDTVYIIDVNKGIVPYKKAHGKDETEEERRAFYVAMTRAKNELIICFCKERFLKKTKPSIFISEFYNRYCTLLNKCL